MSWASNLAGPVQSNYPSSGPRFGGPGTARSGPRSPSQVGPDSWWWRHGHMVANRNTDVVNGRRQDDAVLHPNVEGHVERRGSPPHYLGRHHQLVVHPGRSVPGEVGPAQHQFPAGGLEVRVQRPEPRIPDVVQVRQVVGVEYNALAVDLAVADADGLCVGHSPTFCSSPGTARP